jgi:CBS domain-containing protein
MKGKDLTVPDELGTASAKRTPPGEFVERMLSGLGHPIDFPSSVRERSEEPFRPLRASKAGPGAMYRLQIRTPELRVRANSPAIDVMTDLSRVVAVTIPATATVDEAHRGMMDQGVRALFVLDEAPEILGIITSTDVLGEKPIQVVQRRGVRHVDVLVREVMTPADLLETLELRDVQQARVGDIVETLKSSGRQHALVIESSSADASPAYTVRGMFSLTQIARQMGLPPQVRRDVARTFAEIEAAIGA